MLVFTGLTTDEDMNVAVIKYNAGNVYSVVNALRRLGVEPVLTDDARLIRSADRVVFPGQGEAACAMEYLRGHGLDTVIRGLLQPVLGICIGQQLLCRHSEEGDTDCLGVFDADVLRFSPSRHEDKVPAMGWNSLHGMKSIAITCQFAVLRRLYRIISSRIAQPCRKTIFTLLSFTRKRVEAWVR